MWIWLVSGILFMNFFFNQAFAQKQTRQILSNQQKRQHIINASEEDEHNGPKGTLKKGQGQNLEEPEDPSAKELPLRQRAKYGNEELEVDPD